jgi:hypothetical protein
MRILRIIEFEFANAVVMRGVDPRIHHFRDNTFID